MFNVCIAGLIAGHTLLMYVCSRYVRLVYVCLILYQDKYTPIFCMDQTIILHILCLMYMHEMCVCISPIKTAIIKGVVPSWAVIGANTPGKSSREKNPMPDG